MEEITSKTGNFKKFPVFVKMLISAVKQQSDSVFVDLLTYQDLELLKAKKANGNAAMRQLPASTKRYLILTYSAEFDRVHYPLPLMQADGPDPQRLKQIIQQLRQQTQQQQQSRSSAKQTSGEADADSDLPSARWTGGESTSGVTDLRQQLKLVSGNQHLMACQQPLQHKLSVFAEIHQL